MGQDIYRRKSMLLGDKREIFVKGVGNKRKYPSYIRDFDNVFVLGIRQYIRCPNCGKNIFIETTFPYSYDDLVEMWKIAFNVIVLQEEQFKVLQKINELKNWIEDKIFK